MKLDGVEKAAHTNLSGRKNKKNFQKNYKKLKAVVGDVHTCIYLSIWKTEKTLKNPEISPKTHFL
jgi:hypothetical protein